VAEILADRHRLGTPPHSGPRATTNSGEHDLERSGSGGSVVGHCHICADGLAFGREEWCADLDLQVSLRAGGGLTGGGVEEQGGVPALG